MVEQEEQYVDTLKKVKKIKAWLQDNEDKPGKNVKPIKSNITDNESGKIKTFHGVIQGYDGVAVVDGKHQVIVDAEAFGVAQEYDLLIPMIEEARENFEAIGNQQDVFERAKLTAEKHRMLRIDTVLRGLQIILDGNKGFILDGYPSKSLPFPYDINDGLITIGF